MSEADTSQSRDSEDSPSHASESSNQNQGISWIENLTSIKWLIDDIVIILFATASLCIALFLRLSVSQNEPTLIGIFVGVAVAALTYRYLGGTDNNTFKIEVLKLSGSAALLIGTAWFLGYSMTKEREYIKDTNVNKILLNNNLEYKSKLLNLEKIISNYDQELLTRIKNSDADSEFISDIRKALASPSLRVEIVRPLRINIQNNGAVREIGDKYWICRDAYDKLFPKGVEQQEAAILRARSEADEVDLTFDGFIHSNDCQNGQFQMQITCTASVKLFSKHFRECRGFAPLRVSDQISTIQQATVGVLLKEG